MATTSRADWLIPLALIILVLGPIIEGAARAVGLISGTDLEPDVGEHVFATPVLLLHIASITIFGLLGAFQFSLAVRRRWPKWHRGAGLLLIVSGLAAAFSGIWMVHDFPRRVLLDGTQLLVGLALAISILLGCKAILRRDIAGHRAWMIRSYALGLGPGTMIFLALPWMLLFGKPGAIAGPLIMAACWVINLLVAEWIIRGRPVYHLNRDRLRDFTVRTTCL